MNIEELMKTVSGDLEKLITTRTVVGEPILAGSKTIIPITKVSFGFGSGGGEGKSNKDESGTGGGGAAGAKLEPVAFLVVSEEEVRLLRVSEKTDFGKLLENAPEILEKVRSSRGRKKSETEKQTENTESENISAESTAESGKEN
ncbi:Sporulation protein YtfJ [Methanosalsum zhilinae DSM 4017]|uniref:Sporulation protein YtfJ n=1 Tax=Methanosalsum zhilinae (strain DSM 4017 / NBRC 107636 / OCM 62 / WeN5) TaxID=679901 RepID=F7XN60_METZD|nr:spore germination protein GerW family protein [Methanosalsum zhilinae]AEH60017.1 Sporulation protein YtfJ [Methanosalsum zhilinae DSM 4017]